MEVLDKLKITTLECLSCCFFVQETVKKLNRWFVLSPFGSCLQSCVCVFVLLGAWYGESEHLKSELFSESRSALPVKSQRVMDKFVGKTNVLCTRV